MKKNFTNQASVNTFISASVCVIFEACQYQTIFDRSRSKVRHYAGEHFENELQYITALTFACDLGHTDSLGKEKKNKESKEY